MKKNKVKATTKNKHIEIHASVDNDTWKNHENKIMSYSVDGKNYNDNCNRMTSDDDWILDIRILKSDFIKLKKYTNHIEIKDMNKKGYDINKQITIDFNYKNKNHKFLFIPEQGDWWTSFESKGLLFDLHYDEDYNTISVYEYKNKNTDYSKAIYSKKIMSHKCKWCGKDATTIDYREIDGMTSKIKSCEECYELDTKYLIKLTNKK